MGYTIKFKQCGSDHYTKGRSGYSLTHIAIHYTSTKASAKNNAIYFARNENQGASAHYFVDDITPEIYQSVKDTDTAWAVGDWAMNCRSISIEVVSAGENFSSTEIKKAAWLVQKLQDKYGIPDSRVIRHYDVNGKKCPAPYINATKWKNLKKQLTGGSTSSSSSSSSSSSKKSLGKVNVTYELNYYGGGWLGAVKNFNNSNSNGYAGWANHKHDIFRAKVDKGSIRYRCHDAKTGKWTEWKKDWQSCEVPNYMDGIQLYYSTPSGYEYQQAWYRSQTVARAGWLDVCCDDGNSVSGYDGWAGIYGEGLDRLQIAIGDSDPF